MLYVKRHIIKGLFASALLVYALCGGLARPGLGTAAGPSSAQSADGLIRQFESSYHDIRSLRADFTQESTAWGRTRVESGQVYLERGGKMRWEYQRPESKLFLSDGKNVLLYVPAEKQLTRTPLKSSDDVRVPLDLLVSHLSLRRAFSRVELASTGPHPADSGDMFLRAYPKRGYEEDYHDVLVELTPTFEIRSLLITYPDDTIMKFTFTHIARNPLISKSLFDFVPPAGTDIIQQ